MAFWFVTVMMHFYPSITYHNPTSIYGEEKWRGFQEENYSTDMIATCGARFRESEEDRVLNDKYDGYFCNRRKGGGGGCALWLRKETCSKQKLLFIDNGDDYIRLEALCVKFKYNEQYFVVLVIYSPSRKSKKSRGKKNIQLLRKMVEEGRESKIPKKNYIVIGTFNRSKVNPGKEDQLEITFYDYSRGVSELHQIYGTNKSLPYSVNTRNPINYNQHHLDTTKSRYPIIELKDCTKRDLKFIDNGDDDYHLEPLDVKYNGQYFMILVIYYPTEKSRRKMLEECRKSKTPLESNIFIGDVNRSAVTLGTEDQLKCMIIRKVLALAKNYYRHT